MTIRKTSADGHKVEWLKIQWIQIRKAEPLKMFYKYSVQVDVPFSCVNFAKKGRSDPLNRSSLKVLYSQPRCLSAEKVKDMKKLLKYIPPVHHDFYTRLEAHTVEGVTHLCDDELLGQSEPEDPQSDLLSDNGTHVGESMQVLDDEQNNVRKRQTKKSASTSKSHSFNKKRTSKTAAKSSF